MAVALATLDSRDAAHAWLLLRQVRRLVGDSRKVAPGDAFVAWPGYASDGRRYVPDALGAGAVACLVEAEGAAGLGFEGEPRVAAMRGLNSAAVGAERPGPAQRQPGVRGGARLETRHPGVAGVGH